MKQSGKKVWEDVGFVLKGPLTAIGICLAAPFALVLVAIIVMGFWRVDKIDAALVLRNLGWAWYNTGMAW